METEKIESYSQSSYQRNTLTKKILGIDWNRYFPMAFGTEGVSAVYVQPEEAWAFIAGHYRNIHQLENAGDLFLRESFDDKKKRYYDDFGDFFLVKKAEMPIGILVGTMTDWSTYNLRNSTFLREWQGAGLHARLLQHVLTILRKYGVDRAEADASPANIATVQVLSRARFNITGMNLSERWGSMVHFTKFLQQKNENVFQTQFCLGVKIPGQDW